MTGFGGGKIEGALDRLGDGESHGERDAVADCFDLRLNTERKIRPADDAETFLLERHVEQADAGEKGEDERRFALQAAE